MFQRCPVVLRPYLCTSEKGAPCGREFHEPGFDVFLRSFAWIRRLRKPLQYTLVIFFSGENVSLLKSQQFSAKLHKLHRQMSKSWLEKFPSPRQRTRKEPPVVDQAPRSRQGFRFLRSASTVGTHQKVCRKVSKSDLRNCPPCGGKRRPQPGPGLQGRRMTGGIRPHRVEAGWEGDIYPISEQATEVREFAGYT